MPRIESRFLLMEHIDASGVDLFCVACEPDLEVGVLSPVQLPDRH
jgi:hypothetical protein